MSHHKVKKFTWDASEGRMNVVEYYFHSLMEAMSHVKETSDFDSFKIYDTEGELVHSGTPAPTSTYA